MNIIHYTFMPTFDTLLDIQKDCEYHSHQIQYVTECYLNVYTFLNYISLLEQKTKSI